MVLDHGAQAGVADQRRRERAQAEAAAAAPLDEIDRNRGDEQALGRVFAQARALRDRGERLRRLGQPFEEAELDAGEQHLRVDEAGDQIEHGPGSAPGNAARQRKARCPMLKARAGQTTIACREQAVEQARSGLGRRCFDLCSRWHGRRRRG